MILDETAVIRLGGAAALILGTVAPDGRPHGCRAWSATPDAAGETLRIVIDADDERLLANLRAGSRVALTAANVVTLASLQVKGTVRPLEEMTALDHANRERRTDLFLADISETDRVPAGDPRRAGPGAVPRLRRGGRRGLRPDTRPERGPGARRGCGVTGESPDRPITLDDLRVCCEGVIPPVVSTAAADGNPNITYLSCAHMIDDERIALSNQFFSKTARNIAENPYAQLLLIDPRNYDEFRLDLVYERTDRRGPAFDALRRQVDTVAALEGMQDVFRLRAADVYRILAAELVPNRPARRAVADGHFRSTDPRRRSVGRQRSRS